MDFNDQHLGRLTLIRDLLDRLPITDVETPPLDFPPLAQKPLKERFDGLEPLPSYSKA